MGRYITKEVLFYFYNYYFGSLLSQTDRGLSSWKMQSLFGSNVLQNFQFRFHETQQSSQNVKNGSLTYRLAQWSDRLSDKRRTRLKVFQWTVKPISVSLSYDGLSLSLRFYCNLVLAFSLFRSSGIQLTGVSMVHPARLGRPTDSTPQILTLRIPKISRQPSLMEITLRTKVHNCNWISVISTRGKLLKGALLCGMDKNFFFTVIYRSTNYSRNLMLASKAVNRLRKSLIASIS